ncbi:MAG: FAD-dependent oxidoreductase [Gammaproteobacteria bacterium]|nr:FAD-dependent oxidoreductase [Gammaproteobacteria bacterium]
MKTHAQVVVIGGGVVGCSVLYHLTKLGWKDVVLIERSELTSGSTWHAAGGMHTINSDPNVAKLQDYTIKLYKELEEISGQSCGIHLTGGIMAADTPERLDFLRIAQARGRYLGMDSEFISLEEAKLRHPLINIEHFVGALFDPNEGHVDPSGVTNAYAKSARFGGAEIVRNNRVTALNATADSGWKVITEKGTIKADIVVNAGGLWAREVGRMVGIELPLLAMEHQYLITEDIPEIKEFDGELPHCIDFGGEIYTRAEHNGLLVGTYEKACVPWSEHTTPWDFGHELLNEDLDRIAPSLEVAFQHFPAVEQAGIKQVINGPFTFASDGNPLVGPVRGLKNFYAACGVMAGFSQGGGVGLSLANWIVDGDPGIDVFAMDVARFGEFATRSYTNAKVRENYSRRFSITFPNEELPAARPLRTTPVYHCLKEKNAVFGASYGLEHALWYAPEHTKPFETPTFRRSNAFETVAEECQAVRQSVGLIEISNYAKYDVTGPGAQTWLSGLLANTMPAAGKVVLAPMLNDKGRLIGDFTVAKLGDEHFMIFGSGIAEGYHMRWFEAHIPENGVQVRSLSSEVTGFSIAGPNSRELLSHIISDDVSKEAFRFFSIRPMDIGQAPALVARVSFTGELGYEIWIKADYQLAVYDALCAAGEEFDLRHFGGHALNSLRLEKSFGSFTREYTPDYTPFEAGLERFVKLEKGDFIGRDALAKVAKDGPKYRLVTLVVETDNVDVTGNEPVMQNGAAIGWVTSGGYCHCAGESVAMAYVPAEMAGEVDFKVEILGDICHAQRATEALVDPTGSRMRS